MTVRSNIIPLKGYKAMALWPFVFVRKDVKMDDATVRHEAIHLRQQTELLVIGFMLWYAVEWIVRVLVCLECHKAYRTVGFEQEAYRHEGDEGYLDSRRLFAWMKYIF